MAKHWRRPHRRKDGTWVSGGWVRGSNPKSGCSLWLLGMAGVVAGVLAVLTG